jgi:hypothetical protein
MAQKLDPEKDGLAQILNQFHANLGCLPWFAIFLVYHDFLQPRVAGVGFGGRGAGKCDHLEGVEMVGLASSSGVEICR